MAKPVKGDEFSSAELSRNLEEHRAHERHAAIDGGAAEGVPENKFKILENPIISVKNWIYLCFVP